MILNALKRFYPGANSEVYFQMTLIGFGASFPCVRFLPEWIFHIPDPRRQLKQSFRPGPDPETPATVSKLIRGSKFLLITFITLKLFFPSVNSQVHFQITVMGFRAGFPGSSFLRNGSFILRILENTGKIWLSAVLSIRSGTCSSCNLMRVRTSRQ